MKVENKIVLLENAVQFLLKRAELKKNEALQFVDLFNEWKPGETYDLNEYVTYGIDELGNKQLYRVAAYRVVAEQKNCPGSNGGYDLYRPIFKPVDVE